MSNNSSIKVALDELFEELEDVRAEMNDNDCDLLDQVKKLKKDVSNIKSFTGMPAKTSKTATTKTDESKKSKNKKSQVIKLMKITGGSNCKPVPTMCRITPGSNIVEEVEDIEDVASKHVANPDEAKNTDISTLLQRTYISQLIQASFVPVLKDELSFIPWEASINNIIKRFSMEKIITVIYDGDKVPVYPGEANDSTVHMKLNCLKYKIYSTIPEFMNSTVSSCHSISNMISIIKKEFGPTMVSVSGYLAELTGKPLASNIDVDTFRAFKFRAKTIFEMAEYVNKPVPDHLKLTLYASVWFSTVDTFSTDFFVAMENGLSYEETISLMSDKIASLQARRFMQRASTIKNVKVMDIPGFNDSSTEWSEQVTESESDFLFREL